LQAYANALSAFIREQPELQAVRRSLDAARQSDSWLLAHKQAAVDESSKLQIWCSVLKRTINTAQARHRLHMNQRPLNNQQQHVQVVKRENEDLVFNDVVQWRGLTEIDAGSVSLRLLESRNCFRAGIYDGLTYAQIEAKDPEGFASRNSDKLRYRCS